MQAGSCPRPLFIVAAHDGSWCGCACTRRHSRGVKRACSVSDRLMYVDVLIGPKMHRIIAVYMPPAGYTHEDLCAAYEQLNFVLQEAQNLGHASDFGGDFNSQLRVGKHREMLRELFGMRNFQGANAACGPDDWTFRISAGVTRQIDCILLNKNMCCIGVAGPTDCIDLGSDHRAVYCKLAMRHRAQTSSHARTSCFTRGWKPKSLQEHQTLIQQKLPPLLGTLLSFGTWCFAAISQGVPQHDLGLIEPFKEHNFREPLSCRRSCKSVVERRASSIQIRKVLRTFQRLKQNKKLNAMLDEFRDLGRMEATFRDPVCCMQVDKWAMPSTQGFTNSLSDILQSDRTQPWAALHVSKMLSQFQKSPPLRCQSFGKFCVLCAVACEEMNQLRRCSSTVIAHCMRPYEKLLIGLNLILCLLRVAVTRSRCRMFTCYRDCTTFKGAISRAALDLQSSLGSDRGRAESDAVQHRFEARISKLESQVELAGFVRWHT